jgi:hypothetical protein
MRAKSELERDMAGQFCWEAARERLKISISCFAMTPRPTPSCP